MGNWSVWVYVRASGRCPYEKWAASNGVTKLDRTAIDAKVLTVEQWGDPQLPPETLKDYKSTNLKELKVRGNKKQLRPLCIVDETRKLVILCGSTEKDGKIPEGDLKHGENLREEYLSGKGSIKRYFED
jgi:hypothetical protein